jgi:cell division protein ZapE
LTDAEIGRRRLAARYAEMVAAGDIVSDPAQTDAVARLDRLNDRLAERRLAAKGSALGWLFARKAANPVKGLYIHGEVGRGKTMLMDGFLAVAAPRRKRRAHFHAFMAEVHERLAAVRQAAQNGARGGDPILSVADQIAAETRLLCLDEFMVTDIADAMILSRLFGRLFERGLVLVATSNTAPDDLYQNGLNRDLFLPFVAVLKRHADVVELRARTDYRLENLAGTPVYLTPLGPQARQALDRLWRRLTGVAHGEPTTIEVKGRRIAVPESVDGVARFRFDDLCEAPLGAADFLRLAGAFHTVIVDDVPIIAPERREVARRFVNLVDTFYDQGVRIIVSAAAEPADLYAATEGDISLAFRRTISRLIEMRSQAWASLARGPRSTAKTQSSAAPDA